MDKTAKYTFIAATYIPLNDSTGTSCECCGRLIANIVTVADPTNARFTVGKDCAKTLCGLKATQVESESLKAYDVFQAKKTGKSFYIQSDGSVKTVSKQMIEYLLGEGEIVEIDGEFRRI